MAKTEQEVRNGPPPDDDDDVPEYTGPVAVVPHGREASDIERRRMVGGLLKPVAAVAEILSAQNELRDLIAATLQENRDYGKVPGAERPFLYKAGAERINVAYGIVATFTLVESEVDHDVVRTWVKRKKVWRNQFQGDREFTWQEETGEARGLYRYVWKCQLVDRQTGVVVGEGVGTCSSLESKYCDRPQEVENTIAKMGKKRAYVDATLTTFGLSDQFTQDEDAVRGDGDTESKAKGFDPDTKIGFGKHPDLTWREVCKQDGEYVYWACGRKDGKGMERKLSKGDREKLAALLDEVTNSDQDRAMHRPDREMPEQVEPLNTRVNSPKDTRLHGKTWLEVLDQYPDYVGNLLEQGWFEQMDGMRDVGRALADEVQARRAFRDGSAPKKAGPRAAGQHELAFRRAMQEANVDYDRWQILGRGHTALPESPIDWTDDHYRIANEAIAMYGVEETIRRCENRVRNTKRPRGQAPAADAKRTHAGSKITQSQLDKAKSLSEHAERLKIANREQFEVDVKQAIDADDADAMRKHVNAMQDEVLKVLAQGKAPEDRAAEERMADRDLFGMKD